MSDATAPSPLEGRPKLKRCLVGIGVLFWFLMILWLVFGFYWNREDLKGGNYGIMGGNLLLFVLLFLLGWKLFGFIIQG